MPALWPRRAARVLSIVLVMNALFALLHYVGTGVPAEFAEQRVARAFKHQNLVPEHYPSLRYGLTSNYTLVGIDLYTDCFISLMLLTVGGPSWQDALNPRVAASQPRHGNYCQRLQHLVRGDAGLDLDRSKPKPRLWHGAKAVLAMGLVPFNYFQLNNLLKLCSYFAYAVLALLIYHRHREAFVLALPLLLLGFFSSGVVYHGRDPQSRRHRPLAHDRQRGRGCDRCGHRLVAILWAAATRALCWACWYWAGWAR